MEQLIQVSSTDVSLNKLIQLNTAQQHHLRRAIDEVLFIRWLESKQLVAIKDILKDSGITNLDTLCTVEEDIINAIMLRIKAKSDQSRFTEEISKLTQSRKNIHKEKPSSVGRFIVYYN